MISIIGSGVVGKQVGLGFSILGREVIFHDISEEQLKPLNKDYYTTTDLQEAVNKTDISFICVPTPEKNTLKSIKRCINNIGQILKDKQDYHLLVIKSTVFPGTTENELIPILDKHVKTGENVGVCMNPEFLTAHSSSWSSKAIFSRNFLTEHSIVIGEYDMRSGRILTELYKNHPTQMLIRTDLKTAEMIKFAANTMLATKISFWNEIGEICKELNINSNTVAGIVSNDNRIGEYGTVHGKAYGGACLPKDVKTFIRNTGKDGLISKVNEINDHMTEKYGVRE